METEILVWFRHLFIFCKRLNGLMKKLAGLSMFCFSALWAMSVYAIDPSWVTGPYSWSQGQYSKRLKPVSTHTCVLTKISGDFDGGGEEVKIHKQNGYWRLSGKSKQSGVRGQAYCFAHSSFLTYGSARWSSGNGIWKWVSSGRNCFGAQGNAWWGDATTMLSGISGKLRGLGDRASILQSNGPFTPSVLKVNTCKEDSSGGYLKAYAHSFFAGTPGSGQLAKYWGDEYVADSGNLCKHIDTGNDDGDHEIAMAPVNDAMCHFTSVGGGGDWDGGGEYVTIYPKLSSGVERWFLRAHSGRCGNERRTIARARCYKRDQR